MPAVSMPVLMDFEQQIETAAITIVGDATGVDCFGTLGIATLTMPRIEIESRIGEAVDPPIERGGGADETAIDYTAFDSTLTVRIITDNTQSQSADHGLIRGQVRAVLMQSQPNFNSTTLPFLAMKYIRPVATSTEVDGDFNISSLDFNLKFTIRADAWPL
jgi:hypothetical protein